MNNNNNDSRDLNVNKNDSSDMKTEMDGKYLTFWIDNQIFGIAISDIDQIVSIQKITPMPQFPSYVKGVINLRGEIIPVIDVRLRFNKPEVPYNKITCIIIITIGKDQYGLIVDSVDEVVKIQDEEITAPPTISDNYENDYLSGIAKLKEKVVLLLDITAILHNNNKP